MNKYNKDAVEKAIKKDPRIKPKEAKLIHALLKGHSADANTTVLPWLMKAKYTLLRSRENEQ